MRVLYIMNHVDQGGAAMALYDLLVQLKKSTNIEMVVITGKYNKLNRMLTAIGIENYAFPFRNFMSSYMRPEGVVKYLLNIRYQWGLHKTLNKIERAIDFNKIDIIHSNLNRIDIGAILAEKYKKIHLWHIREYSDIHFKLICIKENPYKYMESFSTYYVAISNGVKEHWVGKGLSKEKIYLIYDGIRDELYSKEYNRVVMPSKIRMIFLGGYCEGKGQIELIEALHVLEPEIKDKIQLDFYGNGSKKYISFLKKKIQEYGLNEQIQMFDYDPNIYKKIKTYHIGLNCSMAEGFGRVTVEYMMSGLCVIASNGGANTELIQDGINGLIYVKGDIKSLAEKIQYLVLNSEKVIEYGKNAQKYAFVKFTMKEHAKNIIELYSKLLEENN